MLDIWSTVEVPPGEAGRRAPAGGPLGRIIRESLQRELASRRGRAPHAQLGVVVGADPAAIQAAFARLHAAFAAERYAAHGDETVALAREICALLEEARAQLCSPTPPRRAPLGALLRRMIGR